MPIVLRVPKGSRLTHTELDGNFSYLENKIDSAADSAYIKGIIDSTYMKGIIDSAYMDSLLFDNYLDSADAVLLIDSAYVNARLDTSSFLDSAEAIQLIDSAYVNARVDASDYLDSAEAIQLIDSAYVIARQTHYLDSDLVKAITLDSAEVIALIDSAYVNARVTTMFVDSADLIRHFGVEGHDGNIVPKVDSAYGLGEPDRYWRHLYISPGSIFVGTLGAKVEASGGVINLTAGSKVGGEVISTFVDSDVRALVDSDYISARQAKDSANVVAIVDSDYAQEKVDILKLKTFATADSATYNLLPTGSVIFVSDGNAGNPCLAVKDSNNGFFRLVQLGGALDDQGGGGGF